MSGPAMSVSFMIAWSVCCKGFSTANVLEMGEKQGEEGGGGKKRGEGIQEEEEGRENESSYKYIHLWCMYITTNSINTASLYLLYCRRPHCMKVCIQHTLSHSLHV